MVSFITGADVLDLLGPSLDELHAATAAPVTARRPWLAAWTRCHPQYEPLAVLERDSCGRLDAVALLGARKTRLVTEFVALGHGASDQIRLPARDAGSAERLARAVCDHVLSFRGPWRLLLRHLPAGDPVAAEIASTLPCAKLVRGDASPTLRFESSRSLRDYVSRNHRQQVRRMLNRMRRDGLVPDIEHLRDPDQIAEIMPQIEDVCRRRDLHLRGRSALDKNGACAFFKQVILDHASRGEVELTTLRLEGRLAAYVLCFVDGGVYRMWSCRLHPQWSRYGPGRVANNSALEHALTDPASREFDWMRGEEPYKTSMSNHVERAQDLLAWSAPALQTVFDVPRRFKSLVNRVDWLKPALAMTKRLHVHGRRRGRAMISALRRLSG